MILDEKLCLIHPDAFESFPCRLYRAGQTEPRHIFFTEFLAERGIQGIPISSEERKSGHLNVVVTKRSKVAIGFASATRVASEMQKYGWRLETFHADELLRGNGGPHCMTCPLLVNS